MFIRIKKRKSVSGTKKFAYLVRSKHCKKGPRQKVILYLGKVFEIKKVKTKKHKAKKKNYNDLEDFLVDLVVRELRRYGFRHKGSHVFNNFKFFIDLPKRRVYDDKNNKIVLAVNYGVLCDYTLNKLFEKSYIIEKPEIVTKDIGKKLISAGISIKNKEFIQLYDIISKKAITNNLRQ
ncbi:MAG: hypothetical protein AABY07_06485 [Nanoarchaeota archaeon]